MYDVTAWGAIQTSTVAMHADGNCTGSSLRSWVLNYITTSVNILWGFQFSVMCVGNILESLLLLVANPIARYIHSTSQ